MKRKWINILLSLLLEPIMCIIGAGVTRLPNIYENHIGIERRVLTG